LKFFYLEEELKRINADKNTYNQVGFNYDQSNNSKESSNKIIEGKHKTNLWLH
jgi:hypothetical protein